MSNYQMLIQKLDEEPSLQYLKQEYSQLINSFADTNLNLKQMISIIWAAEKDVKIFKLFKCLKFTTEIDRLQQSIRQMEIDSDNNNMQPKNSHDEYSEILYDIESRLQLLVNQLSQNGLIEFKLKLNNFQNIDLNQSLEVLSKFIDSKCMSKQVERILNTQLQEEMQKQKKKNFELQIENMKMLSNFNPKDYEISKYLLFSIRKLYSRQKIKQRLQYSLRILKSFKFELANINQYVSQQYQLFFQQDDFIDQLKSNSQFQIVYNKILKNLKQFDYHNLNKSVKQGISASQALSSKDIFITCDKLQQKLSNQLGNTVQQVIRQMEDLTKYDCKSEYFSQYISSIISMTQKNFNKCNLICKNIYELYKEKDFLEKKTRTQLEDIIFQLNNTNLKYKMLLLTKALEKPIKKNSQDSWESLKSIQYQN